MPLFGHISLSKFPPRSISGFLRINLCRQCAGIHCISSQFFIGKSYIVSLKYDSGVKSLFIHPLMWVIAAQISFSLELENRIESVSFVSFYVFRLNDTETPWKMGENDAKVKPSLLLSLCTVSHNTAFVLERYITIFLIEIYKSSLTNVQFLFPPHKARVMVQLSLID